MTDETAARDAHQVSPASGATNSQTGFAHSLAVVIGIDRYKKPIPKLKTPGKDARRVAEAMGFPHYVLDYENMFREAVIDEFADAYLAGATPVPCIRCNERVKFKDLLATARDLDADCMATGHYIQRKIGAAGPELHRAADAVGEWPGKDLFSAD